MYLAHLHELYKDMKAHEADSAVFAVSIEKCPFSCTLAIIQESFHLFITALGENPFTIDVALDRNFNTLERFYLPLDLYRKLREYLGIKDGGKEPFRTTAFLQSVDNATPVRFNGNRSTGAETARLAMVANPDLYEDIDKPYFCGWHKNPASYSVREKNIRNSLLRFPKREVEIRTQMNMSSCWSANPDEENLDALNHLIADESIS